MTMISKKIYLISFWDFKSLATRFKSTKILTRYIFLACIGTLTWQNRNYGILIISNPTTAPVKIMNSNEIPLAFSLCKIFYSKEFNGNFSAHTHTSVNNISVLHGDSVIDMLLDSVLTFERVSYIGNPLICKEFIMPDKEKNLIRVTRDYRDEIGEENTNLHLYIHQPGMFYLQEFAVKYPNQKFALRLDDDTNEYSKIQMTSFDISKDPHMSCSPLLYQECISNAILKRFNATVM